MIVRDLLYPAEWTFRFFIVALLIRTISPYWSDAFPFEATYYVFVIAGAGALVIQIWLVVKFYTSWRQENAPHPQCLRTDKSTQHIIENVPE